MISRSSKSWDAVRRGHRRTNALQVWTPEGYKGNVAISGGSLSVSLSGSTQRSGTVRVPGFAWWPLLRVAAHSWLDVYMTVADVETFHLGQWPIARTVQNRPGGYIELTLGDWADRRDRAVAQNVRTIDAGVALSAMVADQMRSVMPVPTTVTRDDTDGATVPTTLRVELGGNVWAKMTEAANQRGAVIMMTSRSTAEIRVFDPLEPYLEDIDGTVVEERSGEILDEGVNRVIVTIEPEASEGTTYRSELSLTSGPYAYDKTGVGLLPLVLTKRVATPTQAIADAEARRLADRRFGIIRTLSLDVIPQPWLQAGDLVSVKTSTAETAETWMIDAITYPLDAAGRMQLVMRGTVST